MTTSKKLKNKTSASDLITKIESDLFHDSLSNNRPVVDIITFIEDDEYLGLKSQGTKLTVAQSLVLKAFYRGSRGNESLTLNEQEKAFCIKWGLYKETPNSDCEYGDVLGKVSSGNIFRELILVWGRRSGKDFCASLIALYEAYRLLEVEGGDPYKYYGLTSTSADITILIIAAAERQAHVAFDEIRNKLIISKYFRDKWYSAALQKDSVTLLTPKDKENNKKFTDQKQPPRLGSVKIEVGHSNPDTLVGRSCFVLILDEVASYKVGTNGAGSGDKIYALMRPSTAGYVRRSKKFDENGEPIIDPETGEQAEDRIYEGKIVSISSPRGKEGKLFELWEKSFFDDTLLSCRLPTWAVMPHIHTRESLRKENASMGETEFNCEFGAEFSGTMGENMFSRELVEPCFKNNLKFTEVGKPGCVYFVQLDPGTNSHNYALVVCHKVVFIDRGTQQSDFNIIVDLVKYWSPTKDQLVEISEVDDYVCSLAKRFHLGLVAYDSYQSIASKQKLLKQSILAIERKYLRRYKMDIYKELEKIMNEKKLKIPFDGKESELLRNEMLSLQCKYDGNGFKVYPKKDGDGCHTDDLVDSLAGAVYLAISESEKGNVRSKLVNTGTFPTANNIAWKGMQGLIGYGTGKQVSNALEKRASWPNHKR